MTKDALDGALVADDAVEGADVVGADGVVVALGGDDDASSGEGVAGLDVDVDAVVVTAGRAVGGVPHGLGEVGDEAFELVGVDSGEVDLAPGRCGAAGGCDGCDGASFVEGAGEAAQAGGWVDRAQVGAGEVVRAGDEGSSADPGRAPGGGVNGDLPPVDDQRKCRRKAGGRAGGGGGVEP